MKRSRILGLGMCVPDRVVTNYDLAQWIDTSHEWIVERSGIVERRWVEDGDSGARLAADACRDALANAGLEAGDIDLMVFATLSPDHEFPGTGMFTQRMLGMKNTPVLDIRQQCSGFIYGLSVADNFIRSGMYKTILVVGAEVQSRGMDLTTRGRNFAALFGDGAGAAVVGVSDNPDQGILSTHLYADGEEAEMLWLDKPGWQTRPRVSVEDLENGSLYPVMQGQKVFKLAATRMPEVVMEALFSNGLAIADLDLLIPHQANQRISDAVAHVLKLPEDKVFNNIHKYGNTTSATIPLCLTEAMKEGRMKTGDLVCLAAFGAGLTWGSVLFRY